MLYYRITQVLSNWKPTVRDPVQKELDISTLDISLSLEKLKLETYKCYIVQLRIWWLIILPKIYKDTFFKLAGMLYWVLLLYK